MCLFLYAIVLSAGFYCSALYCPSDATGITKVLYEEILGWPRLLNKRKLRMLPDYPRFLIKSHKNRQ